MPGAVPDSRETKMQSNIEPPLSLGVREEPPPRSLTPARARPLPSPVHQRPFRQSLSPTHLLNAFTQIFHDSLWLNFYSPPWCPPAPSYFLIPSSDHSSHFENW